MLIIRPVQDKNYQKELCEKCGVEFDPDLLAYAAFINDAPDSKNSGEFIGICQFKMGKEAHIIDLAKAIGTDDTEAMFIMGRQTMNFIDLHGVHYAYFDADCDEKFIMWLGFKKDENGKWAADLEEFFKHPCASEKK